MSKNGNENVLLKDNRKLIDTEQKLISEGIIFKRRILSHKKENKNVSLKTNNNKKDLSIKITDQYIKKTYNNVNYNQNYNNNIPFNSMRMKKTSITKMNQIPINDPPKSNNIKRNNYIKTSNINKKNFSPVPRQNNIKKNIFKENSYRNYKSNTNRKSLNIIDINDKNILLGGNLSPRTSDNKFENGHTSPIERSRYYLNTNIGNGNDNHKFNYKKWNKITVNNIFDKDINIKMYESPKNNNINDKENNGLINNQNRININDNGIQEIVIQNIKKEKNTKINDIPLNRKKTNSKDNINYNNINRNIVNRNNIFSYCKQMANLALNKEEKNNFIGETLNGLKFDQIIRSPEVKNKIKVCNTNIKRYKSSNKKSNSIEKILTDNMPLKYPESLGNIELKNQKSPPKNKTNPKTTLKHFLNKSQNLSNKYTLDSQNKGIYRNKYHSLKPNANTELNTNVIKIKNSKLIDYIKTDDANINNKKEIIFNKYKDEDEIKEDTVEQKNELYEINEEIFNSNTDLFNEKDKGLNNYTFDNKYEIDSEPSFKMINNYNNYNNNIFNNNNKIINVSNNISKNSINEIPYSLKHSVFTKKKIGGINLKINNISNNIYLNDKNYTNTNNTRITNNTNNTQNNNNILIEEKEKNRKGSIFKNNNIKNKKFNGDYLELAKICYNQEKIISNLVKNVQQLNNQICDKDLCINELNNQLYSIKYDLLNTLQKTNSK